MGTGNKLWNKNFTILWQGQLISDLGNGIFNAILSLWVLYLTKSPAFPNGNTALMGTVVACLALPRVIFGPFAGAFTDRHSRKWIIVFADLIRGILFTGVGLTAILMNRSGMQFPVEALYPVAILSGICSAFFSPAIISAIPDIVPLNSLTKANSLRTFSQSCSTLVGFACGGILFDKFGASDMVLGYGVCFVYASITQLFMHIPNIRHNVEKQHIWHDMLEGMKYTFRQRGIRSLILIGMFLNFFANMGITLLAPLFIEEPGYGPSMYGAVMATMMVGQLGGMALISFMKVKSKDRPLVFFLSVTALIGCMIPVGLVKNVYAMFPLALIIGVAVAIMTILIYTHLQTSVQPESRGRVFGIMSTVFEGLNPASMAISGVIVLIIGIRPTILSAFICASVVLAFAFFNKPFKLFLKSEPAIEGGAAEGNPPEPV